MKFPTVLLTLSCAVLAVPALRAADAVATPPPVANHGDQDHEQTELGEHMEKIGRAFRRLNKEIADPAKHDELVHLAATIHKNATAALELQPEKTADLPAEKRAAFVAAYQDKMKHFIADVERLEAALKAGKNDEAAAVLKTMKADMDESHKEFRKQKKKPQS